MKSNAKTQLNFDFSELENVTLAVVTSQFNLQITKPLTQKVQDTFTKLGAHKNQIEFFEVPGAFELPLVAKKAAQSKRYHAVICLGAVIKGETSHYDFVCSATLQGLNQVSLETEIPIIAGVLTTETLEQAQERIELGENYLISALEMIKTMKTLSAPN